MKKNIFALSISLVALGFLVLTNACTKTNIVEIPPPDYIDIMTKVDSFRLFKVFDNGTNDDRLFKSRNTSVVVKKSATPNEVLFQETFRQNNQSVTVTYRVTLIEPTSASNAVKLSIPSQTINNATYQGITYPGLETERIQGVFEAFDAKDTKSPKTPINNLIFALTVNGERWIYGRR
jgi:hypothetical protein